MVTDVRFRVVVNKSVHQYKPVGAALRYCLVRSEIGGNSEKTVSEAPALSTRGQRGDGVASGTRTPHRARTSLWSSSLTGSLLRSLLRPPSSRARPLPFPPTGGSPVGSRVTKHDPALSETPPSASRRLVYVPKRRSARAKTADGAPWCPKRNLKLYPRGIRNCEGESGDALGLAGW